MDHVYALGIMVTHSCLRRQLPLRKLLTPDGHMLAFGCRDVIAGKFAELMPTVLCGLRWCRLLVLLMFQ